MARPIRVPTVPGSQEWLALRRTGVGASDIPIITGDAPWGDPISLYQDKLGYAAGPISSPSMEAGNWLEDLIARWYAEQEGRRVRRVNALLRNRERPWMIATPDREGTRRLLEVKVTDHPDAGWGAPGTDQVPDRVIEQVQWQAEVADVDVVDIAVFFTRTRRREVYTVGRDRALVDELIEYGAEFWRCVEARTPPQPVVRNVRRLLRADEIEADPDLDALALEAISVREELAAIEKTKDELDAQLKARLDEVGGVRGSGYRIHYRPNADSTRVAWDKVAAEYRKRLLAAAVGASAEILDAIERDLSSTRPGARPLLIKTNPKERSLVA